MNRGAAKELRFAGKTLGTGMAIFLAVLGIFVAVSVVAAVILTLHVIGQFGLGMICI